MLRAGDHVKHGPSGEEWILACDERSGMVVPAGWPESIARASDCTLVNAATDTERMEMLSRVAKSRGDHGESSYRASLARDQLAVESAKGGACG